jgi:hypothetical protein
MVVSRRGQAFGSVLFFFAFSSQNSALSCATLEQCSPIFQDYVNFARCEVLGHLARGVACLETC